MAATSSPGELLTTHKQYTLDTGSIAGWLLENATKCGFKRTGKGRLKGKARAQAREAEKAGTSQPNKYKIQVSEFISMARAIASSK
ncbi:hypothetical protein PG985_009326 [Apiospora marii]|uniref:DUF6604 domain-containing protein n=1 Tax=Apiospora marii TaxID=335849 RepID=A0ABR1RBY3_9PEZI